ncbi:MAG: hypothetical protein KF850_06895 [Labilithrix sp.]|nr:hypothetical protein [Labilithrix sp.]
MGPPRPRSAPSSTLLEKIRRRRRSSSDAVGLDPAFDRAHLLLRKKAGKLLESSLADGQERGIVAPGDARMFAIMTLGALKEILYQVTMRGLDYPEDRIVDELYGFLCGGYLRSAR